MGVCGAGLTLLLAEKVKSLHSLIQTPQYPTGDDDL